LREKCELRAIEKRVLKKIFGPNRENVTADWRKLHRGTS
jgi:hypothetical protein